MTDYIVDIDGTVSDCEWRRQKVLVNGSKNYDEFNSLHIADKPIVPMRYLLEHLVQNRNNRFIIVTGRDESHRRTTEDWLKEYLPFLDYVGLLMRPEGNMDSDPDVKSVILDQLIKAGFNPTVAIDDRLKVCRMWHRRGLYVICVNQGIVEY